MVVFLRKGVSSPVLGCHFTTCLHILTRLPKGLTWHTYRQGSADLDISKQPKKYVSTDKEPKKYFPESKPLKYPLKTPFIQHKSGMIHPGDSRSWESPEKDDNVYPFLFKYCSLNCKEFHQKFENTSSE